VAVIEGGGREAWTNKSLHVVSPANGGDVVISSPDVAASSPAWSPDGRSIAYVAMPDIGNVFGGDPARAGLMQRRIVIAPLSGTSPSYLLADSAAYRDEAPRWSADGGAVLFARLDGADAVSLWVAPAGGGEPARVVETVSSFGEGPSWFGFYGHVDWERIFDWWSGA
jgi:Tol biopolymer transport system component